MPKEKKTDVVYFDFVNKQKLTAEQHARQQFMRMDPVLQQVKKEVGPQQFAMYKAVVDDWMRRNFERQMEEDGGKLYTEPEDS